MVGRPARQATRVVLDVGSADSPLEFAQFRLAAECTLEEVDASSIKLLARARCVGVLRDGEAYAAESAGAVRADDVVTLVAPEAEIDRVAEWFCRSTDAGTQRLRSREFTLDGSAALEEALALYRGESVDPTLREWTIGEVIRRKVPASPVEGDAVDIAGPRFTVRVARESRLVRVGIALPPASRSAR